MRRKKDLACMINNADENKCADMLNKSNRTHKSGWIVIFYGLGISKGLQDGIGLQELFL